MVPTLNGPLETWLKATGKTLEYFFLALLKDRDFAATMLWTAECRFRSAQDASQPIENSNGGRCSPDALPGPSAGPLAPGQR
jgi:hypothetical protein